MGRRIIVIGLFLIVGLGIHPEGALARDTPEPDFAPDRIIVKLEERAPTDALKNINRKKGARTKEKIPRTRINVVKLPEKLSVKKAARAYEASSNVEYAEPDYVVHENWSPRTPNDPSYSKLYGMNNIGQTGGVADADIDTPQAWSKATGSADTVVSVVDTGVDINHPDLKNNIWVNEDEIPDNNKDDDNNGYVDDVNGWDFRNENKTVFDGTGDDHGTHVAGTIGAEGNNGRGVTGVNWRASIMPLKFIGSDGRGYYSDAIEALNYAVANGAKISNHSWGGTSFSQSMLDAINRADAAGHLVVAAAGNKGADNDTSPFYPSNHASSNVISVAATDKYDKLANFSNYGATSVDIAAPGVEILSTIPNDAYRHGYGTSMAAPHVAGVAALLKSDSPGLDDAQMKSRILGSVDRQTKLIGRMSSGGRLNAEKALGIRGTALRFDTNRSRLRYGQRIALSGKLTILGKALPGKRIRLEQRPAGAARFYLAKEVTTNSEGSFYLGGLRPRKNTVYRARFVGQQSEGLRPSTSRAAQVKVRSLVYLNTSKKPLKLGRKRAVAGKVVPRHRGRVMVKVWRNGKLIARKSVKLRSSRYRFTYKPKRPGRYVLKAYYKGHRDHLAGKSPQKKFRVVR